MTDADQYTSFFVGLSQEQAKYIAELEAEVAMLREVCSAMFELLAVIDSTREEGEHHVEN
jgi:hypothetical protein